MAETTKRRADRLTPTQARAARRDRRNRRRRIIRIVAFSVIGVIAFIFVVSLFAGSLPISIGSSEKRPTGPGIQMPQQLYEPYLQPGEQHPEYNSVPATSGWHYSTPAIWGIHQEFIPDETLVHNLRLGGVGIHYNCPEGCADLVAQLAGVANDYEKVVMSPYPGMDTKIALMAWTFVQRFDEFDETSIRKFLDTHINSPNAPGPAK